MADVKWIKIVTNIFDNRKVRQIETMPDGDSILVIWFKLICLAGSINDNGMIYLTPEIPYTDEMLASQFGRPLSVVRLALRTFEKFQMIEVVDDFLCLPSWEKYQSAEKLAGIRSKNAERQARYRERQRAKIGPSFCQYCGDQATGVDHIIALARGGKDVDENKIPCCASCNRKKNDKPVVDFLNSHRAEINDEIILENPKLARFVTLDNVTNRYVVTSHNALDIEGGEEEGELEGEKEDNVSFMPGAEMPPDPPNPPAAPSSPVVISIILNDKTEHPITEADVASWKALYPAVDVMQELRKMKGWADANPTRRKTKAGIKRFINSWLAKEQDNYHGPNSGRTGGGNYGNGKRVGNGPAIGKEL